MKEVHITKAELNLKKEIEKRFLYKKLTIDSNNRVIDETEFNEAGDPIHRITNKYSPDDNISERIEFDASNNLIERDLYNEKGVHFSSIIEFGDGSKTIKNYAYTDLGNTDKVTLTDENGVILGYEASVRDNQDRIICEFRNDANNNEVFKIDRVFDDKGNLTREIQFSNGEIELVTDNFYNKDEKVIKIQSGRDLESFYITELLDLDAKNRLLKHTTTDHEYGDIHIEHFDYDSNDNEISNVEVFNGITISSNLCKYDDSNRLIEENMIEHDVSGSIIKHEQLSYKHDN